jgi:hypothetical protein
MNMTLAITLFLAVDAIVFFFVLRRVVKVHGSLNVKVGGVDLGELVAFSKKFDEEAGNWLQANFSGDPQQLPQALQGLRNLARSRAEQEGLAIDGPALDRMVLAAAINHRAGKAHEIRAALQQAA